MNDRDNLLEHLEEAMPLGHSFKFPSWHRNSIRMERLLSTHDTLHRPEQPHSEGFHSHEREIP
jgi:hypothetical protein